MLQAIGFMLLVTSSTTIFPTKGNKLTKTYIVHLTSLPPHPHPHHLQEWYNLFLSKITCNSKHKPKMIHSYHNAITGFAAKMSPNQAKAFQNITGVLSIRPQTRFRLHTTHSPQFLGLRHDSDGLWTHVNYGKGIIIGVLDTGITPRHPSFHDEGIAPPPRRWKGKCQLPVCNNKLIGFRSFVGKSSPVDEQGHGTHTSSTAAGNFVGNANIFGNANGTASGMAPLAHVAMYKVCRENYCWDSDAIAGIDAAIEDGVDVLSISFGGLSVPFYRDYLAISAFTAIQKGIFVTCSAGNFGPAKAKLSNESPWILTVGAGTIDRKIMTTVSLGNKKLINGESLYQPNNFSQQKLMMPLFYPGKKGDNNVATCSKGSLDNIDIKGKVVLCDFGGSIGTIEKGKVVKEAGGAAVILVNSVSCPETTEPEAHVLPASNVGYNEGIEIKKYLNSNSSPLATILFRGTIIGVKSAPEVACFSSRGPNLASPGILKPDVIGPGVNILAAWPNSVENKTETKATFQIFSGTSMACPHLAGVAALLKTAHPEWSPAAIKSAIMTTASQVNRNGNPIVDERGLPADIFAIGVGYVNPSKAIDPGLVFDIEPDDYIPYLCGLGYTNKQIMIIIKRTNFSCIERSLEAELNYPSFSVSLKRGDTKTYSRTVTNVGSASSTYEIGNFSVPIGVRMVVESPFQELRFTKMHQKVTYKITFSRDVVDKLNGPYGEGFMTWVSGKYSVRTPFSFKF